MTDWRHWRARAARLAAAGTLGVLVLAGVCVPAAGLAQPAAGPTGKVTAGSTTGAPGPAEAARPPPVRIHVPRAVRRELNRAQSVLRAKLARLPHEDGIELLRESEAVILRVPTRLLFEPDSKALQKSAASARVLALPEQLLRRRHRLTARIEVYTDNIGGIGLNQTLSQQRALALLKVLQRAGIPAQRLEAQGQGLSTALASNDTPEGRMRNRRVEFVFERVGTREPDYPAHASGTTSVSAPLRPARAAAREGA